MENHLREFPEPLNSLQKKLDTEFYGLNSDQRKKKRVCQDRIDLTHPLINTTL